MITFTQSDYRRELYLCSGWNINTDDDLPHQPECEELDSAQRKRYLRQTLCGAGGHQPNSISEWELIALHANETLEPSLWGPPPWSADRWAALNGVLDLTRGCD